MLRQMVLFLLLAACCIYDSITVVGLRIHSGKSFVSRSISMSSTESNPSVSNPKVPVGGSSPLGLSASSDRTKLGTLDISSVGMGTISWKFDQSRSARNGVKDSALNTLVETAADMGCDFFDTAERYGSSKQEEAFGGGWGTAESFLSQYIAANRLKVATKFTPVPWRRGARSVVDACEASRLRLGVDSIELYQIHMPDIVQPLRFLGFEERKDVEYWDGLVECYRRGIIKNIGVSNYGPTLLLRAQEHLSKYDAPLASNQINYSLLYRSDATGAQKTVDRGLEMGVRTLAYYPLAMGLLTGKHMSPTTASASSSSINNNVINSIKDTTKTKLELAELRSQRYSSTLQPLLQVMQEIALQRDKSLAQIALNWVICKGVVPIAGARNEAQLKDNLGACGWRLSGEEVLLLESTADNLGIFFEGAGFKRSNEKFVGYGVEKWSLD